MSLKTIFCENCKLCCLYLAGFEASVDMFGFFKIRSCCVPSLALIVHTSVALAIVNSDPRFSEGSAAEAVACNLSDGYLSSSGAEHAGPLGRRERRAQHNKR